MKKILYLFFIPILFYGCSYSRSFYIINYSNSSIQLSYQINSLNYREQNFFGAKPFIYNMDKKKDEIIYKEVSYEFSLDTLTKTIKLELKPNQAVYVGGVAGTYRPNDLRQRNEITKNINRLIIVTNLDTLVCTKNIIPELFSKTKEELIYGLYIH